MNRFNGSQAAILAAALVTFATTAHSQSREDRQDEDVWSVTLGAGAIYRPDYQGSDDYVTNGLPMLAISYRDIVVLRGPSLMIDVFELSDTPLADSLSFGPLVKFDMGREADDNRVLRDLGDIDEGALAGVFVNYELGPVELELEVAQDVTSRHEGLLAEIKAGYGFMLAQRLRAQLELSGTWSDEDYTQAYFGITPAQARASGLREFAAGSGMKDAEAALSLHYMLTEHWRVTGRLAYKRLLGDAADSPLVEDEGSQNQVNTGLLVSYQF
ncbi:MipA/OmpV family protein [Steroidobacter sp. S1-65]|uniref:MipA/OmpV family protein n=1 Tax=Steroidobacter gossypii TaxID=2805490 RepID=A0ABS1X378_9GAMM|nr:MipA/OmpV family protein [Steroidobacter gossypii]MBM0107652.1 MipA/OmpV family protein [Steroidobacter gossypii]